MALNPPAITLMAHQDKHTNKEAAMMKMQHAHEDGAFFRAPKRLPQRNTRHERWRVVHGTKELVEKLGRNDLCPCGSSRKFPQLLPALRPA